MKTMDSSKKRVCPVCKVVVNSSCFGTSLSTHIKMVLDAHETAYAYISRQANNGDIVACNVQRKLYKAKTAHVKELC